MNFRYGKASLLAIGSIAASLQFASAEIKVAPGFPISSGSSADSAKALVESYRQDVQAKPASKPIASKVRAAGSQS